jgi:hypothetical protein
MKRKIHTKFYSFIWKIAYLLNSETWELLDVKLQTEKVSTVM